MLSDWDGDKVSNEKQRQQLAKILVFRSPSCCHVQLYESLDLGQDVGL